MSDEEDVLTGSEEDADFSASEDEWLPTKDSKKSKAGKKSKDESSSPEDDDDGSSSLEDSDLEDFASNPAKNKGKQTSSRKRPATGKSTTPTKKGQLAGNKRKRLTPGLRDRLYQQYKKDLLKEIAPTKPPLNSSVSDILQKCQYQRKSKSSIGSQSMSDDSDSSGDDHLVDPEKLDLGATFFKKDEASKASGSTPGPPQFDVNAGMRLSDSSEGEEHFGEEALPASIPKQAADKLISHLNHQSGEFMNFTNLDQFTAKVEEAKKLLKSYQQRENAGKQSTGDVSGTIQPTTGPQENVSSLLAMGEKDAERLVKVTQEVSGPELGGESTDSEWEEVQTGDNASQKKDDMDPPKESTGGWQVTIEMETAQSKRKRREEIEMELYIKREINRVKRKNQLNYHKSSVLGAICIGQRLNTILGGSQLRCLLMSLMQTKCAVSKVAWDHKQMKSLTKWFKEQFVLLSNDFIAPRNGCHLSFVLLLAVYTRKVSCRHDYILLFLACLRIAGIQARLVLCANVPPKRPAMSDLCPMSERQIKEKYEKRLSSGKADVPKKDGPVEAAASTVQNQSKVLDEANEPKPNIPPIPAGSEGKHEKSPLSIATKENPTPARRSLRHDNIAHQPGKEQAKVPITRRKALSTLNIPQLDGGDDRISAVESSLPVTRSLRSRSVAKTLTPSPGSSPFAKRKSNTKTTVGTAGGPKSQTNTTRKRKLFTAQPEVIPEPAVVTTRTSARIAGKQAPIPREEKEPIVKRRAIRRDPPSDDDDDAFEPKSKPKGNKPVKKGSSNNNSVEQDGTMKIVPRIVLDDIKKSPEGKELLASSSPKAEVVGSGKKPATKQPRRAAAQKKSLNVSSDPCDDSDFEVSKASSKVASKRTRTKTTKKSPCASRRKSTGQQDYVRNTDLWIEFYNDSLKRWITFDLATEQIDCLDLIKRNATSPISYVFAWDAEGHLKDVSARYVKNWNTACRMLRVEQAWLDDALRPFAYEKSESDLLEEKELNKLDSDKPLPTTINELKNHPLYALRRHLLKFEALYPAEPPTLGFVRGEAIYPRECVYTLLTREKWHKQGRVVRAFEKAYKVVKCWKYDRPTNTWLPNQPCDIFGVWQTDEYDPPTAENGLVPRNEYGNVELFTEKMLPKGTAHLKLPGLNKVCKRLQIDCAPAVTGFEMAKMRMIPVYDGFVVCKEYAEQAVEEWYKEMEKEEIREQEKLEKRVYGNWKRLIKGLLVRRKLQHKYNFDSLAL